MAVDTPIKEFSDWYNRYEIDERDGTLRGISVAECGSKLVKQYEKYKNEMDSRVANFEDLLKQANAEVVSVKPDLPNVSSGEVAGMIRRMARNLVQHTPNVDVVSIHDDDGAAGIFVKQILKSKIIGDDQYSNDMQQNLFASAKNSLTLGFDCVLPVLLQDAAGSWYMKYDNIHYRDVFPEPGAKDVRDANDVFIRRYLTVGDVRALVRNQVSGWDIAALKTMLSNSPRNRDINSQDHQSKQHKAMIPDGYEVITYYSSTGEAFLTFTPQTMTLLRIEKNKDPLKRHPVHFLVMEKDLNQPLGKSQVELVFGRQEFQDLMLNGAMKMWYRNINPPIIGYGTVNAVPNLSPGKFTQIANPNAKLEPFEVNTQTLLQYGQIAQQNAGSMVQMVGAADQQMAQGSGAPGGMSATPQGVEAQQQMVDITTNNYQKAIEQFFSRYCSYALTVFFAELKGSVGDIVPTADTRQQLEDAGLKPENFGEKGELVDVTFDKLATEYWVRAVPGSLVEMEDEKQLRILNQLFIPLSQSMPALGASGDMEALKKASGAMMFIIEREIELSGSASKGDIARIWRGETNAITEDEEGRRSKLEESLGEMQTQHSQQMEQMMALTTAMQEQLALLREGQQHLMQQAGIPMEQSAPQPAITQ